MFDVKFGQYLLKVSKNIEFKLLLILECSNYDRAKFTMYLMNEIIEFIVKRMNEIVSHKNIVLNSRNIKKYSFYDILKWVTIHVGSSQTSLSPSVLIDIFKRLNLNTLNYERYYDIIRNLVVKDASNHISSRDLSWSISYDKTHELGYYEEVVFFASREIFFIPNHITITLDDNSLCLSEEL